jgi:hypothetical protein
MATDPVVQAFMTKDPHFEAMLTEALANPGAWKRFSKPGNDDKTLFGHVYDRYMALPSIPDKQLYVTNFNNNSFYINSHPVYQTQIACINILMRLLVAGALPKGRAELNVFSYPISRINDDAAFIEAAETSPTGTTALMHAYETNNKAEFEELFDNIAKDSRKYLKTLVLSHELPREAIQRKDWDLVLRLMTVSADLSLDLLLDPLQLTQLLRKVAPGTLAGLNIYRKPTEDDIYLDGIHYNSKPVEEYLRFTVDPGSPASKVILAPYTTKRLEAWMNEQTTYLTENIRRKDIVKAYTWRGDRLVNSYIRRNITHLGSVMKSIYDEDTEKAFPLAYQIMDAYDMLVAKGMKAMPKDSYFKEGSLNHPVVRDLFLANFKFLQRLDVLLPLIKAYRKEFNHIIKKSPQLGYDMTVFRGIKNEDYHKPGTIGYVTENYLSTSLSPIVAGSSAFTSLDVYGTRFRMFVYEITIPAEVPCLYMEAITDVPGELEILLPHNLKIQADFETTIKSLPVDISAETTAKFLERLSDDKKIITRAMKIVGYAPFEEPLLAYTNKPNKTIKNTKPKAPFLARNRNNTYRRRGGK